jgi:periplasmic protein CpxP/Spy
MNALHQGFKMPPIGSIQSHWKESFKTIQESHMSNQQIMAKVSETNQASKPMKNSRFNTRTLIKSGLGLIMVATLAGCNSFASDRPGQDGAAQSGRGHGMAGRHHGAMDPARMDGMVERMTNRMLSQVNASDEQKAKASTIAKAAAKEVAPLRAEHMKARKDVAAALAAPTIDKAAIETLRSQQIASADRVSKRMSAALIEIAEVLTPEQRAELAKKMQARGDRRGHWGGGERGHRGDAPAKS